MNMPVLCDFKGSLYLIISEHVPALVYYSHFPIIITSLVIGIYVFFKNRSGLANQIILVTTLDLSIWIFLDLVFWATNRSDTIMFVWAIQILIEPLLHLSTLYLCYVLLYKRDIPFYQKFILFLLYVPLIIFVPTKYVLTSFDVGVCLSQEAVYSYYSYLIEVIYTIWLVGIGIKKYISEDNRQVKNEIIYLTIGMIILLLAFSWGAITGSFTEDWNLAQYGLFGMPIFIACLSYTIIKFKSFNLKLIGANVLVLALWILVGSLLAIQDIDISHAVTAITLIITIIFGLILIQSVRNEVAQREKIELLASDLGKANTRLLELDKQKSEFVSFATHQLRAPLTAMKGYASLMLEGDMGQITPEIKQAVGRIYDSSATLTNIVDDYLNISRIELGTMKYGFETLDLKDLVEHVIGELKPNIEKKGLKFTFSSYPSLPDSRFMIHADQDKLKQVIANLIDNSVKYTPSGSVNVSLSKNTADRKVLFSIKDTGVGIAPEVMPKLFSKFVRADNANKQNIYGTGLGLYVAKQIVESHKGRIWAESEGDGKGSQFFLELDMEV
ncbi:MAG: HAMP domain-containing sensor histidine kinase [Candidatus Taylorbacteria bacterium]|nr:HAMP domain-containing sensor histidine kinase [Candidatus Taylorbacteria bacterium]